MSWAVGLLLLWVFACSACLSEWEDWSFSTGVYFFFISIRCAPRCLSRTHECPTHVCSTVGLGDTVPEHKEYMLFNFILILIGLALLSMCFDMVR